MICLCLDGSTGTREDEVSGDGGSALDVKGSKGCLSADADIAVVGDGESGGTRGGGGEDVATVGLVEDECCIATDTT